MIIKIEINCLKVYREEIKEVKKRKGERGKCQNSVHKKRKIYIKKYITSEISQKILGM
jgi:hypothetical protein